MFSLLNILITIIVGAFIGLLAGLILSRRSFGFLGNATVGVMGAALASVLEAAFGFSFGGDWIAFSVGMLLGVPFLVIGFVGFTINATIGAIIVFFLLRTLRHV